MSVERAVSIGVLGTHSTGKTGFLARLAHDLRRADVQVATVADLGEQAKRLGLPILFNHTFTSTLWILTRGISCELEAWLHADVVLVDRAAPDALGYYRAALAYRREQPDPGEMAHLEAVAAAHSHHYDLLLRTALDPAIPLGTNKQRDPDLDFRALADHHVGQVLHDLDLPHQVLHPGNHDQALARTLAFTLARLSAQTPAEPVVPDAAPPTPLPRSPAPRPGGDEHRACPEGQVLR